MTKYEPVIGLEVHVELNTKSKMFCHCNADYFGKKPNSHTCSVCLGLPGALPYTNKMAIESCIRIGLALNCQINEASLFERKNYFYPDLSKGYQISQYRWPLAVYGYMDVVGRDGQTKRIRINRAHQEEDTGKLTHRGDLTLVDFNRSGVPLVEIVTEPDFTDSQQVKDYAKKLQQIIKTIGVSNADMEKGDMRLEANISVRPVGQKALPSWRVELKNINSFRFIVSAIEYEIARQTDALEKGEKLHQETRGWNEDKKETFLQRGKEEANDYRYFPEPDIPPIRFTQNQILNIKNQIPELPDSKLERFQKEYQISAYDAEILIREKQLADYFEEAVIAGKAENLTPKQVANVIINQKPDIRKVLPATLIKNIASSGQPVAISDKELEKIITRVLEENQKAQDDYKAGKTNSLMFLVGQVMRKLGTKLEANRVKSLLEEKLK